MNVLAINSGSFSLKLKVVEFGKSRRQPPASPFTSYRLRPLRAMRERCIGKGLSLGKEAVSAALG
jgi:hypothetical protein